MSAKFKVGQKIRGRVEGKIITGIIDNVEEHRGGIIYDLVDDDGKEIETYIFESQVTRLITN